MPDPWASEGGTCPPKDFEIISKKGCFFQFRGVKTKCHHIWPPLEKYFGKIPYCPSWKKSFRRPWPDPAELLCLQFRSHLSIFSYLNKSEWQLAHAILFNIFR